MSSDSVLYRIIPAREWEAARHAEWFTPHDLMEGGFIHLCSASQVEFVRARHFQGAPDLVLLEIDASRAGEIRYEVSEEGLDAFPHLYGPLPVGAVQSVSALP